MLTDTAAPAPPAGLSCAWALPGASSPPAEALERIGHICRHGGDLYATLLIVLATHQGVPRERLGAAVHRFRPDVADLKPADVAALLTAIWNGGWQGFDAVLRARRRGERKGGGLPFVRED
jgi:hypothetical protein